MNKLKIVVYGYGIFLAGACIFSLTLGKIEYLEGAIGGGVFVYMIMGNKISALEDSLFKICNKSLDMFKKRRSTEDSKMVESIMNEAEVALGLTKTDFFSMTSKIQDRIDDHFKDSVKSITCPVCEMASYNPNDIRHEYCGNCHQYHEYLKREMH